MHRKTLFSNLLALFLGLGLVALLEGGLHLLDLGPSSRLFLPSWQAGEKVYAVNRQVAHRFFPRQYQRHAPLDLRFAAQKPDSAIRVFVLGASTLIGFPHPVAAAFPHFLEKMLADVYPQRRFEVLNCGITAINSFCLLDFMDEIAGYAPDLVIAYAGHNEFMGPYGPTTPFVRLGNDRTWIRLHMFLQRSRVYYFLGEGFSLLSGSPGPQERFGLHLARDEIGLLDPAYQATVDNFRQNLEQMLSIAAARHIPVVLATLVSNLKDFHPLRSECDALTPALEDLVLQGRLAEATEQARDALRDHPYCANLHFLLGHLYYQRGAYELAQDALSRARDLDRLPFRAPAVFNQIIRQQARSATGQVLLADVEAAFAQAAPHGMVGNELIAEYVHPTVHGHYLIARTLAQTLADSPVTTAWGVGGRVQDYEAYYGQLHYPLAEQVGRRNDLILFLLQMPYHTPPLSLRQSLASLVRLQLEAIPRLEADQRRAFVARGGLRFLGRVLDYLLPEDRRSLEQALARLGGEA
jgi:tetratricopeptide (TPR) repeat protein